jgi:thiamine transport system substrate-binding protein
MFIRLAVALGMLATAAHAQDKPVLEIYTYDSFNTEWGPGPQVEEAFENSCGCDLKFVPAGDGAALLARVKLEGTRTDADIVLGLDTSLIADAEATGLFAEHPGVPNNLDLPIAWNDRLFLPYDWGYFAFVYDKTKLASPPASLEALRTSDVDLLIEDPRSSTPGLGLLLWVKRVYGDKASEFWADISPRIVTVTKGWSEAYGLFLDGEADMVLSYTTSPAYHLIAEEDDSKAAAIFEEGHYMQIEVAGMLKSSDQPELAAEFLRFMTTDAFQSVIPTTNWMYPAAVPESGLPDGFQTLVAPEKALLFGAEEAKSERDEALEEWLTALSQ